ncbi:rhodanese-like domain-containing protein [Acetobacter oeni]|uniref:Thiosulfate sulfurtransferase n=1 Tax=Acetobacter oeni TaxID=304077 RepID=A0A511XMD2_9PROT|nr:rhodanese-like domain-containing protein [Acetobacter oeni]MBB3883694.1 rhodanese-related sulfurtransferase [Acetobacter oeni]NHO19725.1 rhodanese-related sulfurtransferase [Acetobacter oeni]GBR02844.1 rhodanese-related sulfurtransferase [Acetobacter oeni LMG 21952]GEN64107.1 thiosulfate sulfurtransferase [Acetobacter oeni]
MNAFSSSDATAAVRETAAEDVRRLLRDGQEIALIDLREEDPFAAGHPLFAVNLPFGRIEERIAGLVPRRTAPVVLYDNDEGRTGAAVRLLRRLGYADVSVLKDDLRGWKDSGGEIFIDVNVPSKSFGELVEHVRHTPSLPAEELNARLERGDDLVILDARRFSEYNTMSIPGGRSVPGGELALRVRDIAPSPETAVVVNCAGRTRSIIGAQSLVNAGIPNPVFALRNGTIGWTLAGLELDRGATRRAVEPGAENQREARVHAAGLADRTGVGVLSREEFQGLEADPDRSLYRLDVRSPEEYEEGHLAGFRSAPGGQLVQATDEWVGVRHGTIVLTDTDGVRARMTGHWLRQLGWREVYVLDDWSGLAREKGAEPHLFAAPLPEADTIAPDSLAAALKSAMPPVVIDLAPSPVFRKGHIPGALFILPAELTAHPLLAEAADIVLTSPDGVAARIGAAQLVQAGHRVRVSEGGTRAWQAAGLPVQTGLTEAEALSAPTDAYKRPYEGTDNARAAMQAYLDWEYGLVAQLERDGTHGFNVLE